MRMSLFNKSQYLFIGLLILILSCKTVKFSSSAYRFDVPAIKKARKENKKDIIQSTTKVRPQKIQSKLRAYNLLHTKLNLQIDLVNEKLQGKAFLKLKPYANNLKELIIDAKYMDINSIGLVVANQIKPLSFQYDSFKINISLNKEYNNGEEFLIFIAPGLKTEEIFIIFCLCPVISFREIIGLCIDLISINFY